MKSLFAGHRSSVGLNRFVIFRAARFDVQEGRIGQPIDQRLRPDGFSHPDAAKKKRPRSMAIPRALQFPRSRSASALIRTPLARFYGTAMTRLDEQNILRRRSVGALVTSRSKSTLGDAGLPF